MQSDGKILAGGDFGSIGGQTRNRMARLDATTGLADSFNPAVVGISLNVLVLQPDGKILVGGTFGSIGGQSRAHIARLDASTGLADSFNPNAGAGLFQVVAIALQADGKILAGGIFTSIGGQSRNYIARLDAVTGLADSFNPNPDNVVYSIAVQTDGRILVGGNFGNIGGQTRNRIARLDPVTGLADSFDPNVGPSPSYVNSIALQPDGKVVLGGNFGQLAPNSGAAVTSRSNIARVETNGSLDQTLNLGIVGSNVLATAVQPDGKILIGGEFDSVLGVTRKKIARLNPDGTLDTAFDPIAIYPSYSATVYGIAVQADGKILASGVFTSIGGQPRFGIARLDATTGAADAFNPNSNGSVVPIVLQPDGKILVGGSFTSIGGQPRNRIARLNPDGTADTNFNPNANGIVYSIAVQADGKILVGGVFTSIGGQPRNHMARLDATTGAADSFNPNANTNVWSIAVQADGKILAGGGFTSIGGTNRNYIARLDAMTGLADSFNPNANGPVGGTVYSIAVQADGKILAGGTFFGTNSIGGQTRNFIARLDATNGLADSFNPNANNIVYSIAVQADGKVLAGGSFNAVNSIGGQSRQFFARLSNDTGALQNLAVTQTSVTWTRGGSSPQFTRVTFESSTNNVNYTPLGNGTPAGSNWTLTGLNPSTGQNIYIRARGYYPGGSYNGSESITESVRNAFLLPLLQILSITRLANGHIVLQCLGAPNQVNNLQVSPDLSPGSFTAISPPPPPANGVGAFQYDDAGAVGLTKRFYRLSFP